MATGHNTNIYSSRYPDPFSQVTTFAEAGNKPMGSYYTLDFDMSTNAMYRRAAPVDGVVKAVYVSTDIDTTAADNAVLGAIYNDTADKTIVAATTYGADPALVADTTTAMTLDTTAANVAVTRGDMIECNYGATNVTHTVLTVYIEQVE